jgi:hypothetical protein
MNRRGWGMRVSQIQEIAKRYRRVFRHERYTERHYPKNPSN